MIPNIFGKRANESTEEVQNLFGSDTGSSSNMNTEPAAKRGRVETEVPPVSLTDAVRPVVKFERNLNMAQQMIDCHMYDNEDGKIHGFEDF